MDQCKLTMFSPCLDDLFSHFPCDCSLCRCHVRPVCGRFGFVDVVICFLADVRPAGDISHTYSPRAHAVRGLVLPTFAGTLMIFSPFTAHFLRPKLTIAFPWSHSNVIIRAYFVTLTNALIWDVTSTVFDVCSSVVRPRSFQF